LDRKAKVTLALPSKGQGRELMAKAKAITGNRTKTKFDKLTTAALQKTRKFRDDLLS